MAGAEKVRLISSARHVYDGRAISSGQVFEASPQDAEDLIAMHFATRYETTDMQAAKPEPVKRGKRGKYKRRDMRAEH